MNDDLREDPDDRSEVLDLLRRRLEEREQELTELESELARLGRESGAESKAGPGLESSPQDLSASDSAGALGESALEPQFRASLGGADREALRGLIRHGHQLETRLEHLRIQVENSAAWQESVARELLADAARNSDRIERRAHRLRRSLRAVAVLGVCTTFLFFWYGFVN